MAKVIFFNPPENQRVYRSTNVESGTPQYPSLTLATLAGALSKEHEVKILDLELSEHPKSYLLEVIGLFKPDYVVASAVTANYFIVKDHMTMVKQKYPEIKTVIGGVHATVLSDEVIHEEGFDIVVVGEGDRTIQELMRLPLRDVPGILYKEGFEKRPVRTEARKLIEDINALPYPDWSLFDLRQYATSHLISRKNPAGLIETSRGCAFHCNFCSKAIFGTRFRAKSPVRVVDEMEYMLRCGFREIQIADDSFTQDISRAKEVCRVILDRKLKFSWSLLNGVRADKVDLEFFQLARKAGCWQTGFGAESGDQRILDQINKKTTLKQISDAVGFAKKAGLNTFGFFILGLSGESEASMRRTLEFAKELPLDIAKFDICIPLPGTAYYNELDAGRGILSKDWGRYAFHQTLEPVYTHPDLDWPLIVKYYRAAYREFYFRPAFILKRLLSSVGHGNILRDFYCLLKSQW